MTTNAVPHGCHTVNSMLVADDAQALIAFLEQVFQGKVTERMDGPDGRVMHAEVQVGDSTIMLGQSSPQWPAFPGCLYLYLEDCDNAYQRGIAAGATSLGEPQDQFWGDRMGGFKDSNGNTWWVAKHIEDVPQEELKARMDKYMSEKRGGDAD